MALSSLPKLSNANSTRMYQAAIPLFLQLHITPTTETHADNLTEHYATGVDTLEVLTMELIELQSERRKRFRALVRISGIGR